jgi:spermidine/putrescine transport system ATP-binding protein
VAEVRTTTGMGGLGVSAAGAAELRAGAGSVEIAGVTKRFGTMTAVDALDLRVAAGEFLSLLGPSGCGKTTTLRMLAGFEHPDSGLLRISGQDMTNIPAHKRPVNTVFQHYALFPHMTVAENVAYGLRQSGTPKGELTARVGEALAMVDMSRLAGRRPKQLSGGQQQRVALARALVNRPAVLLLDEPLGALDRKLRQEMQIELKLLQTQVGITFIYVTHDQEEALSMSDRIAVMLSGRIEQLAGPEEIYDAPATAFVAGFIGSQNFLPGKAWPVGKHMPEATVVTSAGWRVVGLRRAADVVEGGDALAAIRPEHVVVSAAHPGEQGPPENALRGTLAGVAHLGELLQYVVRLPSGQELISRRPRSGAERLDPGREVWCGWDAASVHVFGGGQADVVLADPADEPAPAG